MRLLQKKIISFAERLNISPIALVLISTGILMNLAIFSKMPILFILSLIAGGYLTYTLRKG